MKHLAAAAIAISALAPASAMGPTQIFVIADGKCSATAQPGRVDITTLFPGTEVVYKSLQQPGGLAQSCEITVPKAEVMKRFSSCALASFGDSSCHTSFNYRGGRSVYFSSASEGGKAGYCGFVCVEKVAGTGKGAPGHIQDSPGLAGPAGPVL